MKAPAIVVLLVSSTAAAAASPNPDRPAVADTARLVGAGTVEAEAGGLWSQGVHMPVLAKYGAGVWEPRLGADLSGAGNGAPGLYAGTKVRLVQKQAAAFALGLSSALPVGADDRWWGSARALVDLSGRSGLGLRANTGLELGGADGHIVVTGIPAVLDLGTTVGHSWRVFMEGAATIGLDGTVRGDAADVGLGWTVTDIAVVDAGAGWDVQAEHPYAQLGVTVNLGHPGG